MGLAQDKNNNNQLTININSSVIKVKGIAGNWNYFCGLVFKEGERKRKDVRPHAFRYLSKKEKDLTQKRKWINWKLVGKMK